MGNEHSLPNSHHLAGGIDVPTSNMPMPAQAELDIMFQKALKDMNLTPDKVAKLHEYDNKRKWDLICEQDRVRVKNLPDFYTTRLKTYLRGYALPKKKFKKMISESTTYLRELEISLRTNHVGWVKEFVAEETGGLDLLSEYLSFALYSIVFANLVETMNEGDKKKVQSVDEKNASMRKKEEDKYKKILQAHLNGTNEPDDTDDENLNDNAELLKNQHTNKIDVAVQSFDEIRRSHNLPAKRILKNSKTLADKDDIHVAIMCIRGIMNYQIGFQAVVAHPSLINHCTLAFNHPSQRTKSLVLDLLAAIALVQGGHMEVLSAWRNFKHVCGEKRRFELLAKTFRESDELGSGELLVACMQFINILVHSVEDMNYRVHLQWEFTLLGLDKRLKQLKNTKTDKLRIQIQAYCDNMFDVKSLIEDSEARILAENKTGELENKLFLEQERRVEQEYDAMSKIVELEKQLAVAQGELDKIRGVGKGVYALPGVHYQGKPGEGMGGTGAGGDVGAGYGMSGVPGEGLAMPPMPPPPGLGENPLGAKPPPKILDDDDDDEKDGGKKRKTEADDGLNKLKEEMEAEEKKAKEKADAEGKTEGDGEIPPPPGMDIPAPPPGLPGMGGDIPLPPMMGGAGPGGLKQKKKHQTKYRLPVLNWQAMKPSQIKGTIFNELDDEKILNEIDMSPFEEIFKTRAQDSAADAARLEKIKNKAKRGESLIDTNRARNLAITLRKIGLSTDEICRAVYSYDLKELPLEYVEMLPKFIPNDNELKAFKQYEKQGKPFDALSAEDKFMWLFGRVERLQQRLNIMIFIGNFQETATILSPQLAAVISASLSIKSSQKFKKILELILAFGNYMNSAKRGSVYGFKLASLEQLVETKSTDKKQNLMHYIASVVHSYYPDMGDWHNELRFVKESAKVSLENVYTDVADIKKGMKDTQKEFETHQHPVLKEFLAQATRKVDKIIEDAEVAQEAYKNVVTYFGETVKTMPPETFFPIVDKFIKAYVKAEEDIEKWRLQNEKKLDAEKRRELEQQRKIMAQKKETEAEAFADEQAAIQELRALRKKDRTTIVNTDGAIDENLAYLRQQPYRRADAVSRSFRGRKGGAKGGGKGGDSGAGGKGQTSML